MSGSQLALIRIARGFNSIPLNELTTLERQILSLSVKALGWEAQTIDGEVRVIETH